MTSRLTAFATVFSILAAASLTYAASAQQTLNAARSASTASAKPVRVVQLERVVVTARRLP